MSSKSHLQSMQDESVEQAVRQSPSSSISPLSPTKVRNKTPNICSNKICPQYKNTKYNQNHQNNVQHLCQQCQLQYQKQLYCFYCKQIYFEYSDDGKEWIMCDKCQRWVHTQCADILTHGVINNFNCLRCRKIDQPIRKIGSLTRPVNPKIPHRPKIQQCMLNKFDFYWQLSPAQLAQDIQKLKQFLK